MASYSKNEFVMASESNYGAAELKGFINNNTIKAFGITVTIISLFFALLIFTQNATGITEKITYSDPTIDVTVINPNLKNSNQTNPKLPLMNEDIQQVSKYIAGKTSPISDDEFVKTKKGFC